MILPDVNVLVAAFLEDRPEHSAVSAWLRSALAGSEDVALVDTVLAGFVRVVTNGRIWSSPARTSDAIAFVDAVISAPAARWLPSGAVVWSRFRELAREDSGIRGNLVPDAYLAAMAISHGAVLATADRGFARFPGLRRMDPSG